MKKILIGTLLVLLVIGGYFASIVMLTPESSEDISANGSPRFIKEDWEQGWYYGARDQKKQGTPLYWKHDFEGTRSAQWYDPIRQRKQ